IQLWMLHARGIGVGWGWNGPTSMLPLAGISWLIVGFLNVALPSTLTLCEMSIEFLNVTDWPSRSPTANGVNVQQGWSITTFFFFSSSAFFWRSGWIGIGLTMSAALRESGIRETKTPFMTLVVVSMAHS